MQALTIQIPIISVADNWKKWVKYGLLTVKCIWKRDDEEEQKDETVEPKPGQKPLWFFSGLTVTLHDINHNKVLKNEQWCKARLCPSLTCRHTTALGKNLTWNREQHTQVIFLGREPEYKLFAMHRLSWNTLHNLWLQEQDLQKFNQGTTALTTVNAAWVSA